MWQKDKEGRASTIARREGTSMFWNNEDSKPLSKGRHKVVHIPISGCEKDGPINGLSNDWLIGRQSQDPFAVTFKLLISVPIQQLLMDFVIFLVSIFAVFAIFLSCVSDPTNLPHGDICLVTIFDLGGEGERYCSPPALETLSKRPTFVRTFPNKWVWKRMVDTLIFGSNGSRGICPFALPTSDFSPHPTRNESRNFSL